MTEKLYWNDPYTAMFRATVTGKTSEGIFLSETAFYPEGGGQPGDTGTLIASSLSYLVSNTVKSGDEPLHIIADTSGLEEGAAVEGRIDWIRRYSHMRFHTAIHIIDAVVHTIYGSHGLITGSQIYTDRARVDFSIDSMTADDARKIVDSANVIVSEGHTVRDYFISREDAAGIRDLARTAPGRDLISRMDRVRIVEIEGVDLQADGGTHVRNTREVGTIGLVKVENKGRRNKRMIINLSGDR